jgi:hypothetical protein
MIPEVRFVIYQGNPETKRVALFTADGPDNIPAIDGVVLYAQVPQSSTITFAIACSVTGNVVSIPFGDMPPGHYNYSIYSEPPDGDRELKVRGVVRNGTGLEVVPTPVPAPII